ncbi:MAG: DUF1971 domain-containing protein [Sphingomonadales bacterium]|nr:DUF1971 domain-containing protein [Sphingomonadales bacterium]PIX67217.1 MAG: hypothetical protein COZ43_02455 [Sphingomonadales bacterium CG_4_10_14_3_um_filter_58_15]NCO48649.1 DUF1971 domain-containing protein [Sphingomonadales bacterium]NCO99606.1 DUF1971 domain-containing protein [Sphingomonadales bacterium]NCP27116.1 DUF1971 domain-containing protein [Sphingomonadales bacterium]
MPGTTRLVTPYGASPIFDEISLPDKLRNEHRTKDGTWGLLRVLEGTVELVFIDPPSQRLVTHDDPAPIPPQSPHFVRLTGPMRMQVEFYRENPLPEENSKD